MRVFELHFNPNLKESLVFDSFCYKPENIYEKRMGNLYLIGLLKNVLPQNLHFLDKLTKIIQKEYYRSIVRKPEKALKEGLKEANEFLERIAKNGDVSWLGNLSFAVLSLAPYQNFLGGELNFTKIGDLKIFLFRGEKIIDIDQKLKFEDLQPWPLKIFGNIVSGKLAEGDVLLISTKEVTDFFEKENLLPEIGKIWPFAETSSHLPERSKGREMNEVQRTPLRDTRLFEEKGLKEIFDKKREEILKISGVCLIIVLTKEAIASKKEIISPKSYPKEFNLKEVFRQFINVFKRLIKKPRLRLPNFIGQAKLGRFPKLAIPKLRVPKFPKLPKKLILIFALIFFLALGLFISQFREKKELKERQITLEEIQEKVNQAESFLILKTPRAEKEANLLLKQSFEEISQLVEIISNLPKDFQGQVFSLKDEISKTIFELNKLETIEAPELFFEFDAQKPASDRNEVSGAGFVPQKMIFFNEQLYFFSPHLQNLFRVDKNAQVTEGKPSSPAEAIAEAQDEEISSASPFADAREAEIIEINQKFNLAVSLDDSVLFFLKPNQLTIFKNGEWVSVTLEEPYADFNFDSFSIFRGHLYFLDKNSAEIIKYPYLGNLKWGSAKLWLDRKEEKAIDSRALAVDGSIWLLNKNNSLSRYYLGRLQEKIVLEIFPEPKEFKKIFTSATLPYLYLLEPAQKRMVILDKKGQIIKQFQSQKFDNLLDFAVSQDGKTIYLLNGLKVYKILL